MREDKDATLQRWQVPRTPALGYRLTSTFISTSEESAWDLPTAIHIRDGLRRRAVDAHMLATDAQIGDDLDAVWRQEIEGCDSFLLLWFSPRRCIDRT